MPVHIDLAGLRGELSSARDELEAWAHKLASDAKKDKHAHDLQMERQSAEQAALVERERALSLQVEHLAQQLDEQEAELEAVSEEAQQAREAADAMPAQVATLAADVAAYRARVADATNAVSRRVAAEQQTLQTVGLLVDHYASRLGLSFSAAPGQFVLTYSCLDPSDPERRCAVTLLMDGGSGGSYAIGACEPPVAQAGQLLTALNAAPRGGLPKFVAGMRAAFKEAVAPPALPAA